MAEKATLLQALPPVSKSKLLKPIQSDDSTVSQSSSQGASSKGSLLTSNAEASAKKKVLSQIELLQSRNQVKKDVSEPVQQAAEKPAKSEPTKVVASTQVAQPAPAQEADSGGGALPIVLGLVLLAGIAAGVFFFMRKSKPSKSVLSGSTVASTSTPETSDVEASAPASAPAAPVAPAAPAAKSPKKLPSKPMAPPARPGGANIPAAPARPGSPMAASQTDDSAAPAPNAPSRLKAPAKPKKRF